MASNTLPVVSAGRPFIAPRMSVGMKLAMGFLAVMGVVMAVAVMLSLAEIMHRLEPSDQAQLAATPAQAAVPDPVLPPDLANATLHARAVADTRTDAVLTPAAGAAANVKLPAGAVVQQLVPYQGQLYLLIKVPQNGQRILILDTQSGKVRQDIRLQYAGE